MKSPTVPDLGAFIREQRTRSAMSVRKLADQAGISNPYLSQIERGLRKPSAEILMSIARALDIRTESLYERAGLLDDVERPGVEEAIASDPNLTKPQKQALAEIYRSFARNEQEEAT
ncbi:MAG: helix-turn-helix transcriptional regulator [Acidimicrobiia bacterium]